MSVDIELTCEKCGKLVQAPREAAGRRGKCPYCQASVYIPTPQSELQELPLAAEDGRDLELERALQDERRRIERLWQKETSPEPVGHAGRTSPGSPSGLSRSGIEDAVQTYLRAMRDSNLGMADEALARLVRQPFEVRQVVQRLISDQIPPPALAGVPPAVYQGFLKNLLAQL